MSYANKVLKQSGLIQSSKTETGTFACPYCHREYVHYQNLFKHKKTCDSPMNPASSEKKRKLDEKDEVTLFNERLVKDAFDALMESDCRSKKKIVKEFERLKPIPQGMLMQRFVDLDKQYHREKEDFDAKTRENEKVQNVLKAFEVESPTPVVSSSSSSSSSGGLLGFLTGGGSPRDSPKVKHFLNHSKLSDSLYTYCFTPSGIRQCIIRKTVEHASSTDTH